MASITTRSGKGSPLTHAEVDANFNNLNDGKLDISTAPAGSVVVDSTGRMSVGASSSRGSRFQSIAGSPNINADYSGDAASFVGVGTVGTAATRTTISVEDNRTTAADVGGSIGFGGRYITGDTTYAQWAAIAGKKENGTSGEYGGYLGLYTRTHATSTIQERARIDASGRLLIGVTTTGVPNSGYYVDPNGSSKIGNNAGADGWGFIDFGRSGVSIGTITQSGTTGVAYNTTSDYRLKENITAVTDGIARLQQLKPSRFNFIADPDRTVDGFIAHEAADVVPESVTGEKDATDEDGQPIYQGIDQSKLVPLLTAALQEAVQRIETLEAKVAALEAA